jgi:hypothetical protein
MELDGPHGYKKDPPVHTHRKMKKLRDATGQIKVEDKIVLLLS